MSMIIGLKRMMMVMMRIEEKMKMLLLLKRCFNVAWISASLEVDAISSRWARLKLKQFFYFFIFYYS